MPATFRQGAEGNSSILSYICALSLFIRTKLIDWKMGKYWIATLFALGLVSCSSGNEALKERFATPPNAYRPMPFWHINGRMTKAGIEKEIGDTKSLSGFGGVTVLPVSAGMQWGSENWCPGTEPEYLSEEYFERYGDILRFSEQQGTQVILYDDIDFPSGSAGGRLQREYPEYTRKYLVKEELPVRGGAAVHYGRRDTASVLTAVSALNVETREVLDLQAFMRGDTLEWKAPQGDWLVLFFGCGHNPEAVHGTLVDYMQPEAVEKLLEMTYGEYDKRFARYFGNVITKTFFDDVGFVYQEHTWTPAITELFREKYGKNPALYYPALYYDIGPETGAARVAFFDLRSELMAEGYVKQVSEWSRQRKMSSMGHPPENYSPNSVVVHGDILKFYRHVDIPLLDAIFAYGRGVHGFKQVSSAADLGDKPVVGAELCGAFPADMDSLTLYRVALEAMARGVNFIVPHGMWYDTHADKVRIPPLIAPENPLLRDALPHYSDCVARSCVVLQGGLRVSDIALLWPIAAIQAETYIDRDLRSGLPVANWLPEHVNHHLLSDVLTNRVRRDFTFVHPEDLCNGKITPSGAELRLNNVENSQRYKVLLMPGGEVVSAAALEAIKRYYDGGGKVIATASLPLRSAEFGKDGEVRRIVADMFGFDSKGGVCPDTLITNASGGQAAFLRLPDERSLTDLFARMGLLPDVAFDGVSVCPGQVGYLNYIHKRKEGLDFYYLTNTTDGAIDATVRLRGNLRDMECWNPHTGSIVPVSDVKKVRQPDGSWTTEVPISLPAVSGLFVVGRME